MLPLRHRLRALCFALPLALLAACSGGSGRLPALAPDAVILAFGDSLTHGTGAAPEQSYPAVLESLTGRTVVNAGRPGELSAEGLRRLPRLLEAHAPALVILCHGGNDMLRRHDLAETAQNLAQMIALARVSGAAVVLVGVPGPGLFLSSADFYEEVAEAAGVPLEDQVLPDVLGDNRTKSDAVHPNGDGYRRLAEALAELLREEGAL